MRIAFLNLCHCEPEIVFRVATKLTKHPNFDMYIHVDAKSEIEPFKTLLEGNSQVFFLEKRFPVYWGGYNAIEATMELLRIALASPQNYDYFVLLQNMDYPIKSNQEIESFFEKNNGKEFIRGCNIARIKDWHYARKYRIYNKRDDDFYIKNKSKGKKLLHYCWLGIRSITTIFFSGIIKENNEALKIHYGAAQWAVTQDCANYFINFKKTHPKYNQRMRHIQFPDEEYFHTIVHNSRFKTHCIKYDEPVQRWLVNWRNLHYFEYPKTITIFEEKDFERIMGQKDILFIRKVRQGVSNGLMDRIDKEVGS